MRNIMKKYTNNPYVSTLKALAATAVLCAATSASAQTVGGWSVALGYNKLSPQGTSDAMSAPSIVDSRFKAESDSEPILAFIYQVTTHFSGEVAIGTPYKSQLQGAGALQGIGNLGSAEMLPFTVFGQYRFFEPSATWRPFVGLGVTYAMFRKETGSGALTAISNPGGAPTTFKIDNAWGVTPELGLAYAINDKWFADIVVSKIFISTTVHLSTGQSANTALNPISTAISIGYHF